MNGIVDRPCDGCGHLGMEHSSRKCVAIHCTCPGYRSHARDQDYIERLETERREIGEYVLSLRGKVDQELLRPILGRVLFGRPFLTAEDVTRGQAVYQQLQAPQ